MAKKEYIVTTGINGVDDRTEVGRFSDMESAIKLASHYIVRSGNEAKIESQQVHYRNDKEFTQFNVVLEKVIEDENGDCLDSDVILNWSTPKFRYGQEVK